MPRFELIEGASAKFWIIERTGKAVTTSWGRIGTDGQSKTKTFPSDADAKKEEQQLITEKTRKGYRQVTVDAKSPKAAPRTETTAAKSAAAAPAKPVKTNAKPQAEPKPAAPLFDGSTNRYVNDAGERIDLRVAPGDFPTPVPLSDSFKDLYQMRWSPAGDRIAILCDGVVRLVIEGGASWSEKCIKISDFLAHGMAWSKEGKALTVSFDSDGEAYPKKSLVITFDANGDEIDRVELTSAKKWQRWHRTSVAVHPNGSDLIVTIPSTDGETFDAKLFDRKGTLKRVLLESGKVDIDPSGELMVTATVGSEREARVTDLDGNVLLRLDAIPDAYLWLAPRELGLFLSQPKRGLYRLAFTSKSAPTPELIGPSENPVAGIDVSPDGRLIGVLHKHPATLDLHDASTGARVRRLEFPNGKSEPCFTFAPDGRIAGAVNWQKVVHVYDTRPKIGVTVSSAPSESENRKVKQKFFETLALGQRDADKQIATLLAKGFTLDSIDPPQSDEESERLELLRRVHAGPLAETARTTLVPVLGPRGKGARATRFGAAPVLGPGESACLCPSCKKPMSCLAELDLGSIPEASGLSGKGLVQVLYCTNPKTSCEVDTEAWLPGKGRSKLVRQVSGAGTAKPAPEGTEVIGWQCALDAPNMDDLERASGMKAAKALKTAKIDADEWPGPLHGDKIGGHPAWVQAPEYPNCPRCKAEMTELVLQMASNGVTNVQFGDLGTAYVLRCPSHPEELEMIWQSA